MFENLRADLQRVREERRPKQGGNRSARLENLRIVSEFTTWAVISYRFSRWVRRLRTPGLRQGFAVVAVLLQRWVFLWTGIYIHNEADIGPGLRVYSPCGVFVGPTRIGANFTVGTGVLIAGGALGIGDNVYFGPGAKVIGDTRIGSNVTVVANSLVLANVPDNATVAGVPARRTETNSG